MSKDRAGGSRLCHKCGATILAEDLSGFCAACLLETGLHLLTSDDADQSREMVLAEFGDYELLEEIGRGGQGVIYRARQKSLNRLVALKVIGLGHWATETHLKRFRREAEAAAHLEHPGIVPIYEIGEHDGACFFSMQFVVGGRLDEFVRREPLPLRRAVEIIASLARTVHYAHERGILHRDIKPGNILLDAHGEPHLSDFGLARLVETDSTVTRIRDVLGTPSYIAPEQAVGQSAEPTRATDVYGLGAVFYQLLTGYPPFAGGTTYETIRLVLETEPRNPRFWNSKVDRDLATICLKCLEKEPQRRYPSALVLAEDLERWLGHEPVQARRAGSFYRARKWSRRNPSTIALCSLGLTLLGLVGFVIWNREPPPPPSGIAVLPFENLTGKKEDALFVDGIQEDILTKLARIADLRVTSHTSVMRYRGARNMRQIGNDLHVARILEGSVERMGNRVRINAQLINARTDAHLWAQTYDRELADVFATQSEIAQMIANELRAKVSERERVAIAEVPTKDLAAYRLYVEGRALLQRYPSRGDCSRAAELFSQAAARDPGFFLAWCGLAEAHDRFFYRGYGYTLVPLTQAQAALDRAYRLRPDAAETHLALATHLVLGHLDYNRARDELELARRSLPNNAQIYYLLGFLDQEQNRWHEAVQNTTHALELDPQNIDILEDNRMLYACLRDYRREWQVINRLETSQGLTDKVRREARFAFFVRGDIRPLKKWLQVQSASDAHSYYRLQLGLAEHDANAVQRAVAQFRASGAKEIALRGVGGNAFNFAYLEGLAARWQGNEAAARAAFEAARALQEKSIASYPLEYVGGLTAILGLIDAALGRKEDALREGRLAVAQAPPEKEAFDAADVVYYYGVICAWVGEPELALEQLRISAQMPDGVTYAEMRLDPNWHSLRGDPRFKKIAASLRPSDR